MRPWEDTHTLAELVTQVEQGATATQLHHQARARIEKRDPEIDAWVALDPTSEARAAQLDRTGPSGEQPLFGIPFGVKDTIDVRGLPTRCGSSITSPDPADDSAPCVARLEELGAVALGKTVTTEFAYFKPGPTRNPWNLGHTPGGSSSGSAAAVASGMVPLALGTQTAASLIRPAAYCGIAGLVMGNGTVDLQRIVGLSPSLDSLGFLTRTVADLAIAYAAFSGQSRVEAPPARLLLWDGGGLAELHPAMETAVRAIPHWLEEWDVTDMPGPDHIVTLASDHATVMSYEARRERSHEFDHHRDSLSQPLRELLQSGADIPDDDYWQADYRRERSRIDLAAVLDGAFAIGPAAVGPAPEGLGATGSPIMSRPWQALGFPTVAVPGLITADGLPLGLQMIGAPGTEPQLLAVAERVEARLRELPPIT